MTVGCHHSCKARKMDFDLSSVHQNKTKLSASWRTPWNHHAKTDLCRITSAEDLRMKNQNPCVHTGYNE